MSFLKYLQQLLAISVGVLLFGSCNKDVPAPTPIEPSASSGQTLAELLNDPGFSILKAAIEKAGLTATLSDRTAVYTFFAPSDAAFQASGIPSAAALAFFRAGQLDTLLRYHIVGGQRLSNDTIARRLPNLQLPTLLELAKPSPIIPPGLRMSIFPSARGSNFWVNNIPLLGASVQASNGVMYKTATVVLPPSAFLWNRIAADPNLTYLRAAIQRADEGSTPSTNLQGLLSNPGANFTVFAPNDNAFRQILTAQITQELVARGVPPATAQAQATALASTPSVFTNPALASVLTPTNVRALIFYHILGFRDFSVNLPTTSTATPTLLNSAVTNHPGVMLQATFGATGVTAATVRGAANPSSSNIQINPTPNTGTSDQHYINGVLHVIDQVLRPQ